VVTRLAVKPRSSPVSRFHAVAGYRNASMPDEMTHSLDVTTSAYQPLLCNLFKCWTCEEWRHPLQPVWRMAPSAPCQFLVRQLNSLPWDGNVPAMPGFRTQ
jgi:hypothetical protein